MWTDILGVTLVACTAFLAYRLILHPYRGLTNLLTVHQFGRLEQALPHLVRVIVIADHVEAPQDELRKAVEANFRRGVPYLFLVSKSKAERELHGYYKLFQSLAEIAQHELGSPLDGCKLVDIQALPYEWPRFPFVFYEIEDGDSTRFVAVRGNQLREGIADFYTFLQPDFAHMIASGVLSAAPQPIPVKQEQFTKSNIVPVGLDVAAQPSQWTN